MKEKNLYIIAGCNGAGKTTASFTILPDILDCKEFVNADEIARGLSPFQPDKVSFEAGRIMLNRIENLFQDNQSFAFETTLATKSYKNKIIEAKQNGYEVTLLFFWLNNIYLAIERVATRVQEGGHNIPTDVIIRRYKRGIINLFDIYIPIVDEYMIIDNSDGKREYIGIKQKGNDLIINDELKYERIRNQRNEFKNI
jgi:predicted ABC-type ATPase